MHNTVNRFSSGAEKRQNFYTMKKFLVAGLLVAGLVPVQDLLAREMSFTYDSAGNRVSRAVALPRRVSSSGQEEENHQSSSALRAIKVYPNPTDGLIRVEVSDFDSGLIGSIEIVDAAGAVVICQPFLLAENSLDIRGKAKGIYVMRIRAGAEVFTCKIVKL